jgi:hypothetical protein
MSDHRDRFGPPAKSFCSDSTGALLRRGWGPPRIKVGRLIFYRIVLVRGWLAQQEQRSTTNVRSDGKHLRRAS